jgi:hypothetical protein
MAGTRPAMTMVNVAEATSSRVAFGSLASNLTIHAIVMAGLVPAIHDLSLLPFAAYLAFALLANCFTFGP